MATSITDLFRSETEFDVKASEMYAVMREAAKAELLLNAVNCDVPHGFIREMATGNKEETPFVLAGIDLSHTKDWTGIPDGAAKQEQAAGDDNAESENDAPAAGQTIGSGSVGIIRKNEQRAEWIDIRDIIRKGRAGVSLPPGTEINFVLKNGESASVVVVGVDHYEKGDCAFWFRRIVGRHCMNKDGTNEGGFGGSDMTVHLEKIFDLLPDELQSVIVPHTTIQKIDGETVETESRLFLMSTYEGRGANDWAEYNGIDKQFPFFAERRNRVAYDADGDPCTYWLADPSGANTTAFCIFDNYGDSLNDYASYSLGVAPLFVIK